MTRRQALQLALGASAGLITGGCIVEPINPTPTAGPEMSPASSILSETTSDTPTTELTINTPTRISTTGPSNTVKPTNTQEATRTPEPTATNGAETGLTREMRELQQSLASRIENYKDYEGRTAIAVTDAKTGETINVNGNRPQLTGCVANLPLMLSVVNELTQRRAAYSLRMILKNI